MHIYVLPSLLLFTVHFVEIAQAGVIDLSRYNPSKNNHLEAVLLFQSVLENRPAPAFTPFSLDKMNAVQPSRLAQLYDANNPKHVQAREMFQQALRDGAAPSLLESAQERLTQVARGVQSALTPSGVNSMMSFLMSLMKTILTALGSGLMSGLTTLFPPLAFLNGFNPVAKLFGF